MFTSLGKLALLGGAPLLILALAVTSQAAPPAGSPYLQPRGAQQFHPGQPPVILTDPKVISPIRPFAPIGSDPRTWSPYPLVPPNGPPGSDPRTWSPYPVYPNPWPYPPYPYPYYPVNPYSPGPYPNPYYPGQIGAQR
jgi:hypothetical protein